MTEEVEPLEEVQRHMRTLAVLEQRALELEERRTEGRRMQRVEILVAALLCGSVAAWLTALLSFDPNDLRRMTDVGLVSVLPPAALAAPVVLTLSFCLTLWRVPASRILPLFHVLGLIVMLFGTPAIIEQEPRVALAWRHAGIAEAVVRTGHVFPHLDIYGDWPGFFIVVGFLAKAIGVSSPLAFATWASVFFNLLYLAPLLLLLRSITSDRRTIWLAVWLFYVGNWVGQDYLSPQGLAYVFYLSSIALLVRIAAIAPRRAPLTGNLNGRARATTPALLGLAVLLALVAVPMHQLTPVQLTLSVGVLAFTERRLPNSLPFLVGAAVFAWAVYMATPYLAGNLGGIIGGVGNVGSSVNQGVAQRVSGSPGHVLVTQIRLAMVAAFAMLALAGVLRLARARALGRRELQLVGLAAIPVCLTAVQSYGGEVGLRAFLYALPFLSFFGARALEPARHGWSNGRSASAAAVVLVLLLACFPFVRYGNERSDYFTRDEKRAADYVYVHARPGSLILGGSWSFPWHYRDYELLNRFEELDTRNGWSDGVASGNWRPFVLSLWTEMRREQNPAYLIVTRSQAATQELYSHTPGALEALTHALRSSPRFRIVYGNRDASVFTARRPL